MYPKIALNILMLTALVLVQQAFVNNLPWGLARVNLVLIVLVFILGLINFKAALWWGVGVGLFLDIYSFNLFGIYLVTIFLTILLANFLLVNFVTNRSLYSFIIISFLAFVFYELLLIVMIYITSFFDASYIMRILKVDFWKDVFWGEIYNIILVVLIFYFINFLSHKLKPVFLIKDK